VDWVERWLSGYYQPLSPIHCEPGEAEHRAIEMQYSHAFHRE
jgi:hypothetical protein